MINKKFMALLLAVCLCAGALPMMVFAGSFWNDMSEVTPTPMFKITQSPACAVPGVDTITLTAEITGLNYEDFYWLLSDMQAVDTLGVDGRVAGFGDGDNQYGGDGPDQTYGFIDGNNFYLGKTLTIDNVTADMNGVEIRARANGSSYVGDYATIKLNVASPAPVRENGMGLAGPYIYDTDEDIMMTPAEAGYIHEYGDAAYYLLLDEVSEVQGPMSDNDYVEKLKVKAKGWTNGGDIVEGVEVVKCKVNADALLNGKMYECASVLDQYGLESGYYYFLKIDLGEKQSTAETDVIGVVEFNRKADSKKKIGKIDESSHNIDFSVFYEYGWITKFPTVKEDRVDLEWGTTYALKFDYDDEVELSFGNPNGGNNEGTFEVDISGQGKILLSYTTDPVEAIAAANEGAEMDFIIFNNARFGRTGVFTYEMENGVYAYRIVDGRLVEMPECYDEAEDAFVFHTNTLGGYVFADRALVNPA